MPDDQQMLQRVAIIGGGPAGLSTARALKEAGIPFTLFEKHSDVGGIWDIANPGSPMYRTAHFISSRTMSGHRGFPMPDSYPDYPSNAQILAYARSFAAHFGLYEDIRLNTPVLHARPDGEGWALAVSAEGGEQTERYRWLVCASGTNWHPNRPALKGEAEFAGTIRHSVDYHDNASLSGKRVLVVGGGNSGVDIACDAAVMAGETTISLRRGYHFIPKHIFGQPADVFGAGSDWMPMWMEQRIFGVLLRLLTGDLERLGLARPDHKIFESHPILNSQLLHYLQHGDVIARPDIDHLDAAGAVFNDGSRADLDEIILATGYDWSLPYLDDDVFEWQDKRPKTFLKIFNPNHPGLFINGFVETNSGAYKLFDEMALLIVRAIEAQMSGPEAAQRLQAYIAGPEPDLGGPVSYVASARHSGYANIAAYSSAMKRMRRAMAWAGP
tara:strand:- start:35327 stop:36652 length:1326 start_codon:yes stop_codon:yes gene_type:complete